MKKHDENKEADKENVTSEAEENSVTTDQVKHKRKFSLSHLLRTKKRRVIAIVIGVVLLLALLFAIPFTRYGILGLVVKKDVTITIIDSKTKQPVSNALVKIGNVSNQTDKNGVVKLNAVPVGQAGVEVTKQYYTTYDHSYTVPVLFKTDSPKYEIVATGRQVTINVVDTITGKPLGDAVIATSNTKATTNSDGTTALILAPTPDTQKATVTKPGYNSQDVDVAVGIGAVNTYNLTPSGSIYYLSNATGKVNVMKSNLDGTNPVVAVEGTGQESDNDTSLLSSRDWQYSALLATRTDGKQGVYLYDAQKDDLSLIDLGEATFQAIGWSGHNFIYIVNHTNISIWQDNRQALNSFNADTRKITVLDQTIAHGDYAYNAQYQSFGNVYILNGELVYSKIWAAHTVGYALGTDELPLLVSVNSGNSNKKTIKTFNLYDDITTELYEPQSLYVRVLPSGLTTPTFYEYENGAIKTANDTNDSKFYGQYKTYLISPSGNKTLWREFRDGKDTILVGDADGGNAQQIAVSSGLNPYGWYGANDEFILLSKNGGELYIAPSDVPLGTPVKIADYLSGVGYPGYGAGYGGQ